MSVVGFVGLGNMGGHMARNLMKHGQKLIVFDVNKKVVEQFKAEGAMVASHPADVAAASKDIITMLPSSPHVRDVYGADNGLLKTMQAGTLCMDSSTIDQVASIEVAELCAKKKSFYVDAPVSGGVGGALDGTLTFMVGSGECEKTFKRASEYLKLMGKNIVDLGKVGNGQAAKICNNMLLGIEMIGVAETMNLGIRMGLNAKQLAGIINTSTGRCWASDTYNPVPGVIEKIPPSNGYQGGFGAALMAKAVLLNKFLATMETRAFDDFQDLSLAQNASTNTQSPTPLGSLAHQMYRILAKDGKFATKDFGVVYKYISEESK